MLSIPLDRIRLVKHSDAAFQNEQGTASQAGFFFTATDGRMAQEQWLHGGR